MAYTVQTRGLLLNLIQCPRAGPSSHPDRRRPMEKVIVEIRAAEGGDDAKSLVRDQLAVYAKFATRRGL